MTVLVILVLPLLLSLGVWQQQRGALKRQLEEDYLVQLTQLPMAPALEQELRPFLRVKLSGRFSDEVYLVDNQVHDGQIGYWIIHVFEASNARRYLVNRGFIAAAIDRARLPNVRVPAGDVSLIGMVWPDTGLVPMFSDDPLQPGWPKRVQRLDPVRLAVPVRAEPFEIRLESGQPGVTIAAPFATLLTHDKHAAYAVTWFGLAIVLSIGYLVFARLRARD
jgi:cytochrome oxidase assembly protein ShyY1